jgi:hypothetical protein
MLLVLAVPFLGVIAYRIARLHCMPASDGLVTGGPAHTLAQDETARRPGASRRALRASRDRSDHGKRIRNAKSVGHLMLGSGDGSGPASYRLEESRSSKKRGRTSSL